MTTTSNKFIGAGGVLDIVSKEKSETLSSSPVPLLSVCIPTYNRATIVGVLVTRLLDLLARHFGSDFEVVVSDNRSSDGARSRLEEKFGQVERLRIVSPEVHYPTAEENLCFAVSKCRGEYVWTLGDDDAVEAETLVALRRLLEEDRYDLLIFNSRMVSYFGHLLKKTKIPCLAPVVEMPMLDFVRETGFWFVLAGFSTTVFRRSKADTQRLQEIFGIGKIYSHVTWLVQQFHDSRFAFINRPLVTYRENLTDVTASAHWEKVAVREGLFIGGIWSTGFLRQMDHLVNQGIFARGFLREVVDRSLENRYYFPDEILRQMLRGLARVGTGGKGTIPASELAYFCSWLYELHGENIYLISLFEEMVGRLAAGGAPGAEVVGKLLDIVNVRAGMKWFEHFHLYDIQGFSVFRHGRKWFAILKGEYDAVNFLLEAIDFGDFDEILFVRSSEEELLTCLAAQPRRRFTNEPVRRFQPHSVSPMLRASIFKVRNVYRREGITGVARRVLRRVAARF